MSRSKANVFAFVLMCLVLTQRIAPQNQTSKSDEDAVRTVTTRFTEDYVRADAKDLETLWSPKSTDPGARGPALEKNFADFKDPVLKKFEIHKVTITGDQAKVYYTVRFVVNSKKTGGPIRGFPDRDINALQTLIKENGEWRVMTADSAENEFVPRLLAEPDLGQRAKMLDEFSFLISKDLVGMIGGQALDAVFKQRDYPRALAILEFVMPIAEKLGDKRTMADLYSYLGLVYEYTGDYGLAILADIRYKELSEEAGYAGGVSNALNSLAGDYDNLGQYDRALSAIQQSIDTKVDGKVPIDRPVRQLSNLANAFLNVGEIEKAIETYRKAADYAETNKLDRWRITAYDGLVNSFQRKRDFVQAQIYATKTLELAKGNADVARDKGLALSISEHAAEIALALGNYEEALALSGQATNAGAEFGFDDLLWAPKLTAARALLAIGKTEQARDALNESIAIIERSGRKSLGGEDNLQSVIADRSKPYKLMATLAAMQGNPMEALTFADRARARVLLSTLSGGRISAKQVMTAEERRTDQALTQRLAELNRSLVSASAAQDRQQIETIKTSLNEARSSYEIFRDKVIAAHPKLLIQLGEVKPLDDASLGGLIGNDNAMLAEYIISDDGAYVLTLTKDRSQKPQLKAFPLPGINEAALTAEIESFVFKMSSGDLSFQKESQALYDELLKPIESEIGQKTSVIIVPDGPMWRLPMQALQDASGKYLVERASISYAPSLAALQAMSLKSRAASARTGADLVAFGNPTVNKETAARVGQVFMDEKLEPLPEAERLVNTLAKMYGPQRSKIYTGAAAREETAKSEAPKYRIVQFATHGILNDVSPMYSHLVLAQDEKDPNEDGLLEAWELKDLDLKADMVILSACDTARGKISSGEGIIGMTWAAFIAGAPTTVASQWKVESTSTTELMLEFHRQLLTGKVSKAEALRRAQLKLMRDPRYKHPSYWGAWVIVGDAS